MKRLIIALLALAMTAFSGWAADAKRITVPGTDDMSRYLARPATPAGQSTLRDASGRTVGTVSTAGSRMTFRDSSGRTTGSASVEGGRTVFRDASGRTVGTA